MRLYPLTTHSAFAADLTIFAAASLKEALDEQASLICVNTATK
jgi:ABC-type molybdate transport system substrate-binding protein